MNGSAEADFDSNKTRKEECVHVGGKRSNAPFRVMAVVVALFVLQTTK